MKIKEIAKKLRVSTATVTRWINGGKLKATMKRTEKLLAYEIEETDLTTYLEELN